MKLIQKFSYASAVYLSSELKQGHRKKSEYYYGFQAVYGAIFKLTILLVLAKLLGCVSTMIIVALTFATFRFFAGGVHMNTYAQCAFITLFFFLPAALAAQVLELNRFTLFAVLLITLAGTLCSIIIWAPKDSPFNAMSETSKKKLKKLSILCLFIWMVISLFFIYIDYTKGAVAIYLALIIETSTFIPITANLYNKINALLNRKR